MNLSFAQTAALATLTRINVLADHPIATPMVDGFLQLGCVGGALLEGQFTVGGILQGEPEALIVGTALPAFPDSYVVINGVSPALLPNRCVVYNPTAGPLNWFVRANHSPMMRNQ